jgi:hypothetical protein
MVTTSPLGPYALQLLNRRTAAALGLGEKPVCLIRFGGNEAVVRAQTAALSQVARPEEVASDLWTKLRGLDGKAHTSIRISGLPQGFLAASAAILADDAPQVYTSIDPRRGVLRIVAGADDASGIDSSEAFAAPPDFGDGSGGGTQVIFEKLPSQVWPTVSPSVVADSLSQGIKRAYDPHHILNPGILGD